MISNIEWMTWNVLLALIPVLLAYILAEARSGIVKAIVGFLWLIFLPNTIYILTDLIHIPQNLEHVTALAASIILLQYALLIGIGISSYIFALYPIRQMQKRWSNKKKTGYFHLLLYICNISMGFGIMLGRIERTNSWDILTNTPKFIQAVVHAALSPLMVITSIMIGITCSFLYLAISTTYSEWMDL